MKLKLFLISLGFSVGLCDGVHARTPSITMKDFFCETPTHAPAYQPKTGMCMILTECTLKSEFKANSKEEAKDKSNWVRAALVCEGIAGTGKGGTPTCPGSEKCKESGKFEWVEAQFQDGKSPHSNAHSSSNAQTPSDSEMRQGR